MNGVDPIDPKVWIMAKKIVLYQYLSAYHFTLLIAFLRRVLLKMMVFLKNRFSL